MTDYLNVNGHNKKDKAYQEMKKNLTDLNTSIVEADTHIQEAKAALEETRENLKQWQIDRWERAGDKQDASLSYKKNADDINYQLSANDYEERLKLMIKLFALMKRKDSFLQKKLQQIKPTVELGVMRRCRKRLRNTITSLLLLLNPKRRCNN